MALSRKEFEKHIVPGKILYFPCVELGTPEPHYFICITLVGDDSILSCCTSQFETVKRLIEKNRYPNSTLVFISAGDVENQVFKKDTYINCNEYFPYTVDELWDFYIRGFLSIKGELPNYSLQQLVIGFLDSELIEEDIKESLPDPDDFN